MYIYLLSIFIADASYEYTFFFDNIFPVFCWKKACILLLILPNKIYYDYVSN